jgi:cytochrome c553
VAVGTLYALGTRKVRATHDVPAETELVIPTDSASIARGATLVGARPCRVCHGEDLGGNVFGDDKLFGRIVGANLTRGRGGLTPPRTDIEWERAIRHGVRRGGRSLIIMPSEAFNAIADDEMASMIAYLKQVPPVDREVGPTEPRILARALLAVGQFKTATELTPSTAHVASIDTTPGLLYGQYLVKISGCSVCHGQSFSGGPPAAPGEPPFPNLTPTGIGHYTEDDFIRALRTGQRPRGGATLSEIMPWKYFGTMSDGALHSIWLVLQTLPPKEFGEK